MAHPQMLRGVRLINAIILGTTDGAQLQTLLADGGRAAAFNAVLQRPGQMIRMAASSTAMAAVAASSTAMAAVAASSTAMAAVAASSTAMAAISAVSSARSAFINSTEFTVAGVPAMTSATAPSGLITTNDPQGVMGSNACIKALDKNASSYWQVGGGEGIWVGYEFPTERIITRLEKTEQAPASYGTATGRLQAFSGGSWVDCVSFTGNTAQPAFSSYTVTKLVRSKRWRFINDTTYGGYINIKALGFVGFNLGV